MKAKKRGTVYCSGPLFSPEDVGTMAEIARVLKEADYKPFLPHRDGVEAFVVNAVNNPLANLLIFRPINRFISRAAFALDIYKVLECDYFVFNMNGRVPDEGGVVETGVAFAAGKPIVIYKDDARSLAGHHDNPMLTGATYGSPKVDDIREIPGQLERIAGRLQEMGENPYAREAMPGFVRQVASFGEKVWRLVRVARFVRPPYAMASK